MIRVEIDKGEYRPKKQPKLPYLATTNGGKVVLAIGVDEDDDDVLECVVLRPAADRLQAGDLHSFDRDSLIPLKEDETLVLTNTWEIVND